MTGIEKHPSAMPEVEGPASVPTGSKFETSTENYSDGAPDVPEPEWLKQAAKRIREKINLGVALAADEPAPHDNSAGTILDDD